MRRRTLSVLTSLLLGAGLLAATAPATAHPGGPPPLPPTAAERAAERTLEVAQGVLDGRPAGTGETGSPDQSAPSATLALRDLSRALPRLSGSERAEADRLLARPTDGARDEFGDGYRRKAVRRCSSTVCVHHVPRSGRYADPDEVSGSWAQRNLDVMTSVHRRTTRDLGYRRPLRDGKRGGDGRFDVYLKDIGDYGLYGYCAAERRPAYNRRLAVAYCVLDEDFARSEFGGSPGGNLRVTAAHEFFHAVQFAYDADEDGWMMEATSTWIEERLADDVDDNRQYLRAGQLGAPHRALDYLPWSGFSARPYGNWVYFENLSKRFGRDAIRNIWWQAAVVGGAPRKHSVAAIEAYLADRGGLPLQYAQFAVRNSIPRLNYPEGSAYRPQPLAGTKRFRGKGWYGPDRVTVHHLASRTYRISPAAGMTSDRWKLRINIDAPPSATPSRAVALLQRPNGRVPLRHVELDADGDGSLVVDFDAGSVSNVYVSLVNTSTRYYCNSGGNFACGGTSKDDGRRYRLTARAFQG